MSNKDWFKGSSLFKVLKSYSFVQFMLSNTCLRNLFVVIKLFKGLLVIFSLLCFGKHFKGIVQKHHSNWLGEVKARASLTLVSRIFLVEM